MRGPINDRFTDWKRVASGYQTWMFIWFTVAVIEFFILAMKVIHG